MNKNTIYGVVAAAVIIIAVAAVAGYYLLMNPGGETPPTPVTVETATSLKYDATVTSQGSDIPYQFAGTDLNTTSLKLRIDVLGGESGNYSYILNAEDQTAWSSRINGPLGVRCGQTTWML
jgi:multidrug efflux pump subunit AcrA (membrane-fusion protein)